MRKYLVIYFLIFIFVAFSSFVYFQNSYNEVIKVISPKEILIDLNKDKNSDEVIVIPSVYTFSTHLDKNKDSIYHLKISKEDSLKMGYLAEEYAKLTLEGKKVKIIGRDVFVNGVNYRDLLINNGFALPYGEKTSAAFESKLNKAKKLKLVILNNKSFKYHRLDCEYGLKSSNFVIMPKTHVPREAVPCKFCLENKSINNKQIKVSKPSSYIQNKDIKMVLSDMTKKTKPDNGCDEKICKFLVNEINSAKESIDFAIYGYVKNLTIENALKDALARGVKIRFVFDSDASNTNYYPDTYYLATIFKDNNFDKTREIMHNKFFIFDNKKVLTGSTNLSNSDMSAFNSNVMILINSAEIASIYKREFEQMYSGKFHNKKAIVAKKNDSNVRVYFSPKDEIIINEVIPLISKAKDYIYIPTFILTHEKLIQNLILAKQRGVNVKIILDSTNQRNLSKIKVLRGSNIPVKTENFAGKLHSKSIVVDDKYLIIGSMNFSISGESRNDENVLIIENEELAKFYKQFFEYLWVKIPDKWLKYTARSESPDSIGSCFDGVDNDFDGNIDLEDEGCKTFR